MKHLSLLTLLVSSQALAAPMQLTQQGRLLDAAGGPLNGVHSLTLRLLDGTSTPQFSETFPAYDLQNGYFSVILGGGGTPLDTSVFLTHGAMDLEVQMDGTPLTQFAVGGYPVVVAQQSLLALESTAQQSLLATQRTYSKDCADWSTTGWASQTACLQDGRWHLYGHSVGSGWSIPNALATWQAASIEGADTKMRIGREWYPVTARSTDNAAVAIWVFVQTGARHLSFQLDAAGNMPNVHSNSVSASFDNRWLSDLGNWHYFTSGYSNRGTATLTANNGVEIWARY